MRNDENLLEIMPSSQIVVLSQRGAGGNTLMTLVTPNACYSSLDDDWKRRIVKTVYTQLQSVQEDFKELGVDIEYQLQKAVNMEFEEFYSHTINSEAADWSALADEIRGHLRLHPVQYENLKWLLNCDTEVLYKDIATISSIPRTKNMIKLYAEWETTDTARVVHSPTRRKRIQRFQVQYMLFPLDSHLATSEYQLIDRFGERNLLLVYVVDINSYCELNEHGVNKLEMSFVIFREILTSEWFRNRSLQDSFKGVSVILTKTDLFRETLNHHPFSRYFPDTEMPDDSPEEIEEYIKSLFKWTISQECGNDTPGFTVKSASLGGWTPQSRGLVRSLEITANSRSMRYDRRRFY